MRQSSIRRRSGFTLIEVLLTLTIASVVIVVVYGVLRTTIFAAGEKEDAIEGSHIGPAILNIMRQDLESAIVTDENVLSFQGIDGGSKGASGDRLDFLTTRIALVRGADEEEKPFFSSLNEAGYQLKESPAGNGLFVLYRREQTPVDDDPVKGGDLAELYDRVKSLELLYYDGEEWQKEWDNVKSKGMPAAVRIELALSPRPEEAGRETEELKYLFIVCLTSSGK
ncbi:MAG: hypothetical protein A2Z34_09485 [Planctomycetes bacterium RBG_16_59_8]|nr:MAG: hypothetical protein A2Z34_09485 [Planctomycetes bacterium RBG_16_59_8]